MWDDKRKIVDALVAAKDEPSYDLLACICWNHCCHGPIEAIAFQALEGRGKASIPVLMEMLRKGPATCTVGAAAKSLARMKEAPAFDEIVKRLGGDADPMFPMDIAGALVLFGDARAVPALVRAMDIDAPPVPRKKKEGGRGRTVVVGAGEVEGLDLGTDGRAKARGRATLALGEFDTKEAREALERGAANPEIGGFCHAVLWRLTKDETAHGKAVAAAMHGDDPAAKGMIGPYLARIDHPNARFLLEEWKRSTEPKAPPKKK